MSDYLKRKKEEEERRKEVESKVGTGNMNVKGQTLAEWRRNKNASVAIAPEMDNEPRNVYGQTLAEYRKMRNEGGKLDSLAKWKGESENLLREYDHYSYSGDYQTREQHDSFSKRLQKQLENTLSLKNKYKENVPEIDEIVSRLSSAIKDNDEGFKYYSQWEDDETYQQFLKYQQEADAAQKNMQETEKANIHYNSQKSLGNVNGPAQMKYAARMQDADWNEQVLAETAMNRRKEEQDLEEQQKAELIQKVAEIPNAKDFEEKSQYIDAGWKRFFSGDRTDYEYINDTPWSTKYQGNSNGYVAQEERLGYDYLTDEERKVYNYFYNTDGNETAAAYLETLNLTERMAEDVIARSQEYAKDHPWLASAESIVKNVAGGGMGFAEGVWNTITGKGIDVNSYTNLTNRSSNAIVETVAEGFGSETGSFLYQTGMSMANSIAAIAATSWTGPLGLAPGTAAGFVLGSNAATNAMLSAKERGVSDGQALATGLAQGAAEMLFEKYSIGELDALKDVPVKTLKDALGNVLRQAGVEGSEEVFTSMTNALTDLIINGELSESQLNIQNYINQGYSEEEASRMAAKNHLGQLITDFLGGAVSGGVMSSGAQTINYANRNKNTEETTVNPEENAEEAGTAEPITEDEELITKNEESITQPETEAVATEENTVEEIPWEEAEMYSGEVQQNTVNENSEVAPAQPVEGVGVKAEVKPTTSKKVQAARRNIDTILQYGQVDDKLATEIAKNPDMKTALEEKTGIKITGTEEQQRNGVKEVVRVYGDRHGSTVTQSMPTTAPGKQNAIVKGRGVEIIGVQSESGSNPKFKAADGKSYTYEEIAFADDNSKKLYASAAQLAIDGGENVANEFIKSYDASYPIAVYSKGFQLLYNAGRDGVPAPEAMKAVEFMVRSTNMGVMSKAWTLGYNVRKQENSKVAVEKKQQKRKGKGTFEDQTRQDSPVIEIARLVADRTGIDIVRKSSLEHDANAAFVPSTMTMLLSENAQNEYTALIHELGEFGLSYNREGMKQLQETFIKYWAEIEGIKGIESIDEIIKNYQRRYAAVEGSKTKAQAMDEIVNDALGGLFSTETGAEEFVQWLQEDSGYNKTEQRTIIQRIIDTLDQVIAYLKDLIKGSNLTRAAQKAAQMEEQKAKEIRKMFLEALDTAVENANTTGVYDTDAAVKNSLKEFAEQYDAWDGKNARAVFDVTVATDAYKFLGKENKTIRFDASKIIKIKAKHAGMTDAVIKQIPEVLNNPVLIMKSKQSDTRIVTTGMLLDEQNKPVVVVLELEPTGRKGIVVDEIKVASAYGKDGMQNFINKSEVLYTNPNKQIINRWTKRTRLQLPVGKASVDYNNIVSDTTENASSEMKFSLAGADALTVDNDSRIKAYYMEQEGKGELEIFRETGWFRGADGKWRFEIDDSEAKIYRHGNAEFLRDPDYAEWNEMFDDMLAGLIDEEDSELMKRYEKLSEKARLLEEGKKIKRVGDYLEHPSLFDAYPFIKNIRVNQVEEEGNRLGSLSMFDGINVVKRYFEEYQELNLKKTLLHEIQHAIQHYERFAGGANGNTWKYVSLKKEQQKYNDAIKRKRQAFDGGNEEFRSLIRKLNHLQMENNFGEEYDRIENELYEKYEKRYMDYDNALFEARLYAESEELSDFEKYEMTAGEIEARDTENRSEWTAKERKNKLPNRTTQNGVIFTESRMENPFEYREEDIKFSLPEEYDELRRENESLLRENETFKQIIDSLENRLNLQKGVSVSKGNIEKVVDKLYKKYKSNADKADFTERVTALFQSGESSKGNFLFMAEQIMRPVLENSKNNQDISDYAKGILKDIRKTTIKLDGMQKNETSYHYGTYNDFRKSLFGRANFSDKGTQLDILWKQWAESYPELFDADISPVDQPMRLAAIIADLKEGYVSEYGFVLDDAVSYAAMELMNEYASLPEIKKLSDSASDADFRAKYWRMTNMIKKDYQEQLKSYKARMRETRVERFRRQEKKKCKDSIIKNTKEITKLFEHNTDKYHVPEVLRETTLNFLKSMDFLTENGWNTQDTIQLQNRLNILYRKFSSEESDAEGSSFMQDIDPDFLPTLDGLISLLEKSGEIKKIADMDIGQLKDVEYLVRTLKRTISTANKLIGNKRYEHVSQLGDSSVAHMGALKAKKHLGKWLGMGDEMLNTHMLDSFSFFERMGEGAKSIHQEIRDGFNKRVWMLEEAKKYMQDVIGETKIKNWTGKKAELHEFNYNGQEFGLTTGQLMNLYVLSKRPQAFNHLMAENGTQSETGGFTVDAKSIVKGQKVAERRVKVSDAQMKEMFEKLTPEQKKMADAMQKFLAKNCSEWGNEVTMTLYGYKKFGEKTYWPIKTNENFNKTDDRNANSAGGDNTSLYAIRNQGMTKNLVKNANNPIVVGDIFEVFSEHVANMANYNAFVVPLTDAMKWFNYRSRTKEGVVTGSVKEEMERAFGKGSKNYFITFIKDVNGEANKGTASEISNTFTSKYKAAAVGANARSIVQQPTSYFRAASVMNPKYLAAGLSKKPAIKEMHENSAIAIWKSWGYFETGLGQSMKQVLTGEGTVTEKIVEASMAGTGKADDFTWGVLWNAVKAEVKDKNKDIDTSSKEYMELVSKRFDEVVDQTQVVDTVLHRSQIMRSQNGIVKMATAFMSEPTKSYNLLHNAVRKTMEHNTSQNRADVARKVAVYAFTGIATAFTASFVDAFRDDDEEKEYWDKWLENFWANARDNLNPFNMIPYLKEIPSLWEGYDSSRLDMAGISSLVTSVQQAIKFAQGDSQKNLYGVTKGIIRGLSQTTGIPLYNALRDTEALIEQFTFAPIDEKELTAKDVRIRLLRANKVGNDKQLKKYLAWYDEQYREKIAEGKTDKEARSALKSSITSQFKEIYQNSTNAEKIRIKQLLLKISVNGKQLYKDYDWSSWDKKKED